MRVATGAALVWLPGPVIAAHGCDHRVTTQIGLEPGARLLVREELVLGRHREHPGTVRQRLRVSLQDRPLHDQELHIGPGASGWDGPAVTGGRPALGCLLLVDPDSQPAAGVDSCAAIDDGDTTFDVALMPLGGPAALLTALASDALTLRRRLDAALAALGRAQPDVTALTAS